MTTDKHINKHLHLIGGPRVWLMAGRLSFETFRCGRHSSRSVRDSSPRGKNSLTRIEIVTDVQEKSLAQWSIGRPAAFVSAFYSNLPFPSNDWAYRRRHFNTSKRAKALISIYIYPSALFYCRHFLLSGNFRHFLSSRYISKIEFMKKKIWSKDVIKLY